MRTVDWDYKTGKLLLIDQRKLPGIYQVNEYQNYQDVIEAIQTMVVRGAPAIGVTAAYTIALCGFESKAGVYDELVVDLTRCASDLQKARPTAVNLGWAIHRMLSYIKKNEETDTDKLRIAILGEAQRIADEDVVTNLAIANYGSKLINDGDTILHHCNTGALAAVDWGTALGVIRKAHEDGKRIHVLVDETRPRLQGSRLTAWELAQYKIPYDIITDNAAGYFLSRKMVHKVFFGADRVASNGDVVNKIGTYMLALAAFDNGIPAYAVMPTSTIDSSISRGDLIPIEERPSNEVLNIQVGGEKVVPEGSSARNPAFDITPNRLLTAIVTEKGVLHPPFAESIRSIL
jgi:methylthioribose-1-phosphate isomerase